MKRLHFTLFCSILLVSCGEPISSDVEPGTNQSELRVPGPWDPPQSTRNIAATQYVPVVDPPAVSPLGSCSSSNAFACSCRHPSCKRTLPGTAKLNTFLLNKHNFLSAGGTYCCRQNSARTSVPKLSVHATGRAIDLMVPLEGGDANNGLGDQVANWLVENAEFIGIQRVIWDKKYWNGERGFGNLSSNSLSHTNHIHLELNQAGAQGETPFFTSGAVNGTCTTRCNGDLLIKTNCTTVDCAANNTKCLPGAAPKCSDPPPPEPPKAVAGGTKKPTMTPIGDPARLTFLTPKRLFDTRDPAASKALTRGNGSKTGPLTGQGVNVFKYSGLPASTVGTWINIAAINGAEPGFISIAAGGEPEPETSNVNYYPGYVRANAAPARLGAGNDLSLYAHNDVHAVVDLYAAFTKTGQGMTTTGPSRVYDSRAGNSILKKDEIREVHVRVPPGSTGVVATIAAIQGKENGFIQAFACGDTQPVASNINYTAGQVSANTIVSKISADGKLCIRSISDIHIVVDVTGYFSEKGPLSYQFLKPKRLLDTRDETSLFKNRMGERQSIKLPIQALPNMPDGVWSVVANLTVVGANKPGFITAYPCGGAVPSTSSLNYSPDGATGAVTVSPVGVDGTLCLFSSSRAHVIVDVVGVWIHDMSMEPPKPDDKNDPADEGEMEDPTDPHTMDMSKDMISSDDMSGGTKDMSSGADMSFPDDMNNKVDGPNRINAEGGCQSVPVGSGDFVPQSLVVLTFLCMGWFRRKRD